MPEDILACDGCGGGSWTLLARGRARCLTCEQVAPDVVVGTIKPDAQWWGEKKPRGRRLTLAGEPVGKPGEPKTCPHDYLWNERFRCPVCGDGEGGILPSGPEGGKA